MYGETQKDYRSEEVRLLAKEGPDSQARQKGRGVYCYRQAD
jgi:hypothetical protein